MTQNPIVLTRPKPLSYSLSMSLIFHALFILILGQKFLFDTVPPTLKESQMEFRIIPKKTPPQVARDSVQETKIKIPIPAPVIRQILQETPVTKINPVNPVQIQQTTAFVAVKGEFVETAKIASFPMEIASHYSESVKGSSQSYSTVQAMNTSASATVFGSETKPRPTNKIAQRGYGRKALVQNEAFHSFVEKVKIAVAQPQTSSAGMARQAVGIRSAVPMEVFAHFSIEPRPLTQLTDRETLKTFLQGVQKSIGSARHYPEEERQALHTGRIKVAFRLLRNGNIELLRLKQKSKHVGLNQAALDAVSQVVPFQQIPAGVMEDFIDLVIPFRFDLK
ncbi:MAG: energy transducer TonB [Nitrospina sp.]|jgi:TonB family protein|nr:energy transducer TonB [Nitrospina sp.]MBT3877210.1 energy transducer TonB [Nitrospina sp.]MBT4046919.1 energy transducer TonB [Nitrospina sp.]MBT4557359.1 energy transducer TonB [Nitrospina sp.]MBT5350000.1 energy transducer TonB [Nitrospina sp.]